MKEIKTSFYLERKNNRKKHDDAHFCIDEYRKNVTPLHLTYMYMLNHL